VFFGSIQTLVPLELVVLEVVIELVSAVDVDVVVDEVSVLAEVVVLVGVVVVVLEESSVVAAFIILVELIIAFALLLALSKLPANTSIFLLNCHTFLSNTFFSKTKASSYS
jgi:hypothetical protein